MNRDTIFGGNISILLAVIFFSGISSDKLSYAVSYNKSEMFTASGHVLMIVVGLCCLSLASLHFSGVKRWQGSANSSKLVVFSYYVLIVQIFLLSLYTLWSISSSIN